MLKLKLKKIAIIAMLAALPVLGLYGCGSEPATPTPLPPTATIEPPTATAEPPATTAPADTGSSTGGISGDAVALIDKAQTTTAALTSYHFVMRTETDAGVTVAAEGDFQKPDRMRMVMDLGELGKTETILLGEEMYMKQPGTEQYMSLGATGSGLAGITNPDTLASFAEVADSASVKGDEQVDGVDTTIVEFTYDVNRAMDAMAEQSEQPFTPTAGMGKASGMMWIEKSTNYIRQLRIITSAGAMGAGTSGAGQSTVTITYSKFGEPISPPIEKPTDLLELPSGLPEGLPGGLPGLETPQP